MRKFIFLYLIILISHNSYLYSQNGWIAQQSGTTLKLNKVFFINSQMGWISGESGKILKTIDGGNNWVNQNSNTNLALRSIFFINENSGWAAGGYFDPLLSQHSKLILKTTNGGDTWSSVYYFIDFNNTLSDIYFVNQNTGYAIGSGGTGFVATGLIMNTTNGGNSWAQYDFGSSASRVQFTDPNTGWIISKYWSDVGQDTGYVFKSINNGTNWSKIYQSYKVTFLSSYFLNNLMGWVNGIDRINFADQPIIMKTIDGGINWQRINLSYLFNSIHFTDENSGWGCGTGIFNTTNSGKNWNVQLTGNSLNSIIFLDSLTGWVAGSNGKILKTTTGGLTSINSSNEIIPDEFSLSQNYPNPFNPTTNINFSIPKNSSVTLKVYDMLGKEVATLVNENLSVGIYNFDFNASNLTSGIYYYKLMTDNFSETKKMMLIK